MCERIQHFISSSKRWFRSEKLLRHVSHYVSARKDMIVSSFNLIYIVTICKQPQRLTIWALKRCSIGDRSAHTMISLVIKTSTQWLIWWSKRSNNEQFDDCDAQTTSKSIYVIFVKHILSDVQSQCKISQFTRFSSCQIRLVDSW